MWKYFLYRIKRPYPVTLLHCLLQTDSDYEVNKILDFKKYFLEFSTHNEFLSIYTLKTVASRWAVNILQRGATEWKTFQIFCQKFFSFNAWTVEFLFFNLSCELMNNVFVYVKEIRLWKSITPGNTGAVAV